MVLVENLTTPCIVRTVKYHLAQTVGDMGRVNNYWGVAETRLFFVGGNGMKSRFEGWICKRNRIAWVVSGWRKDKRTGVIKRQ